MRVRYYIKSLNQFGVMEAQDIFWDSGAIYITALTDAVDDLVIDGCSREVAMRLVEQATTLGYVDFSSFVAEIDDDDEDDTVEVNEAADEDIDDEPTQ